MKKSLVQLGLKGGLHILQTSQVRGSRHSEEFLVVLEHLVLLDLPLPLLSVLLYLLLLLLVGYLFI